MIYTKKEWYTPGEVAVHNHAADCWVSLNGKVLNLTSWLEDEVRGCKCIQKTCTCVNKTAPCSPYCFEKCTCFNKGFKYCIARRVPMTVLAYAGKDISHWFDGDEWVRCVHPVAGSTVPRRPHGPGAREPHGPSPRWRPVVAWWRDDRYVVGKLTSKTRPIRIVNTLTGSTVTLEVCSEESIHQIMMRYLPHNAHLQSYALRHAGRRLRPARSLRANGVPDQRELFARLGLPENEYIPALFAYFNDDLTVDPPVQPCFCSDRNCLAHHPDVCK